MDPSAMMATLNPQQRQMFMQQMAMQNQYMTNTGFSMPQPFQEQQSSPPSKHEVPPTKQEKLKLRLKPSERGFFSSLFDVACPPGGNKINGKDAAAFLRRSGLSKEALKQIWEISDQNSEMALTRDNFYIALRLVALAQNGYEISPEGIISDIDVPLPRFEGSLGASGPRPNMDGGEVIGPPSKYSITDEEIQKYSEICKSVDTEGKGYLNSDQVDIILEKTHLPGNVANTLKIVCDEQGSDTFPLPMAIVMVHLAVLAMKKIPLPKSVPLDVKKKVQMALGGINTKVISF